MIEIITFGIIIIILPIDICHEYTNTANQYTHDCLNASKGIYKYVVYLYCVRPWF